MIRIPMPSLQPLDRAALPVAVLVAALLATAGVPPAAAAANQEFGSREQVTAVDLAVDLDPPHALRPWARPPRAAGLRVDLEGTSLPVVSVDPPPADRGDAPWSVVLYIDLALSDRSETSWAAETLSRNLPELTRFGDVEVVVADPEPRTLVSPTRDNAAIRKVLDHLVFFPEAEDALVEARLASAETAPATEAATRPDSGAATGAGAGGSGPSPLERALVRDRLDRLLLAMVDRTPEAAPRRAVFLVTGGYDLDGGDGALSRATDETAATLAAYGWTVVPLLEPPPSGTVPGLRIGKWRFHKATEPWLFMTTFLGATRESERDPEKAKAFLELARSRQRQGELDGAARAARQAMTHFADDPRTAELQAQTLLVLAHVYEAQGRPQLARRTYLRAATRDPEGLADLPEVVAAVHRPEAALERLARATLGSTLRSEHDWTTVLHALDRRGLVTVQLAGAPDGRLHAAHVLRAADGKPVPAVGDLRFGTPRSVVSARARSLLDDVPAGGNLPVTAALLAPEEEPGEGPGDGGETVLTLRADPSALTAPPAAAILRVTLAMPESDGAIRVIRFEPESLDPAPRTAWGWQLRRPIAAGADAGWGVVVVDELSTGAWGAALAQGDRDPVERAGAEEP